MRTSWRRAQKAVSSSRPVAGTEPPDKTRERMRKPDQYLTRKNNSERKFQENGGKPGRDVCVRACVRARVCVCICVYAKTRARVCTSARARARACTRVNVCMPVSLPACLCVCVCVYACVWWWWWWCCCCCCLPSKCS